MIRIKFIKWVDNTSDTGGTMASVNFKQFCFTEWLLSKDSFECSEQREAVNAYVLVWLSGHPDVIANVETRVMPFIDKYPELLFPMMHGSAKYALSTNKKDQTQVNSLVSGLKAVDRYCRSSKSLRKDPDLKLHHKLIRKKKISSWIEDQQKV